jgi:TolB-like protein
LTPNPTPGIPHDRYPQIYGTASPDPHESKGRRGLIFVIAVLAIVAAVAAFIWKPTFDTEVPTSLLIAVLPFANLSEAEEQAYLANGFADDLTTELAHVPDLFVVSRNAACAYRDSGLPPAEIAKELGVRYLLEGSVRRLGDEVRINAHLVDDLDGRADLGRSVRRPFHRCVQAPGSGDRSNCRRAAAEARPRKSKPRSVR